MDKLVLNVIHMPNQPDSFKRALLSKLAHSPGMRRTLEKADIMSIFDTCMNITTSSETEAPLAVFAFSNWASQYKICLKEYMTPERVASILACQTNVTVIIAWLKEALCHLRDDTDTMCTLAPVLEELLQNKLRESGGSSAFVMQLAELYTVCPVLLPQPHTRLTFTITLMECVAAFPTPTKPEVLGHMKSIGGLVNTLWNGLRLEDILFSLNSLYTIISNTDGGSEVCPAMAHLLSLVPTVVVEALAPRIVSNPSTTDAALSATLTRLTAWLVAWPTAYTTLGLWVRTLVRLLYQSGRTLVPARVTLDRVPKLIPALHIPVVRPGVVSVMSTLLLSFRSSPLAFHKVVPALVDVFGQLEREGSPSSRATLDHLASLCHTLMTLHPGHQDTYQPLMDCLVKYQPPSEEDIQSQIQEHRWGSLEGGARGLASGQSRGAGSPSEAPVVYQQRPPSQKVGLRNLGNTCYMNSVIQALFMTDSFRHGVLRAVPRSNQQLLVKLQHLFSMLCFTHRTYVAPRLFHDKSRPSWFSPGMQQDCSEYLRHLMITLHEEERAGQALPEYQERVIIESETASLASDLQPLPYDSATEDFVEGEQPSKVESGDETQGMILSPASVPQASRVDSILLGELTKPLNIEESIVSSNQKRLAVPLHVQHFKEYLQGEPMEGLDDIEQMNSGKEHLGQGVLQESADVDMLDVNHGVMHSHMENEDENFHNMCDNRKFLNVSLPQDIEKRLDIVDMETASENTLKSNNFKRKHNTTPDGATRQMLKSPKGDMTSDIDNSSDSGISGDLAEDVEVHVSSPNPSSPLSKEVFSENKGLTIEEVSNGSNNEDSENEYFVSLVHKVFGGKLATCIKCLQCKTESIHKDVFTDIHLAFQDTDRYNASDAIRRNPSRLVRQANKEHPGDLSIEDMIRSYLTSERLTGENQYECERCGGKQDAERSIQILEPPEHLILTQLRFYYDTARSQRQKVFTNVEFGEELLLPIRYSTQGSLGDDPTKGDEETFNSGSEGGSGSENRRPDDNPIECRCGHNASSDRMTSDTHTSQAKCNMLHGSKVVASASASSEQSYQSYSQSQTEISHVSNSSSCNINKHCEEASGSSSGVSSQQKFCFCTGSTETGSKESQGNCSTFHKGCNNSHIHNKNNSSQNTGTMLGLNQCSQACTNTRSQLSHNAAKDRFGMLCGSDGNNIQRTKSISSEGGEDLFNTTEGDTLQGASCDSKVTISNACDFPSECIGSGAKPREEPSLELGPKKSYSNPQPSCSHALDFLPQISCSFTDSDNSQDDSNSTVGGESRLSSASNLQQSAQPGCSYKAIIDLPHVPTDCPISSSSGSSDCLSTKDECEEAHEVTYARYALYGVVVHSGFSSEGGHYYCYARNSSIAALPESARERFGIMGGWYNFNDEKVTNTTFSNITSLTRTFNRDTAYQLFYKKLSDCLTPDVPLLEDFKCLRLDLQEAVENDNLQYRSEQERESQRRKYQVSGRAHFSHDPDHDDTPPPGGCGAGPGGGGFNTASRVVF